jgi:hypothetical protein
VRERVSVREKGRERGRERVSVRERDSQRGGSAARQWPSI